MFIFLLKDLHSSNFLYAEKRLNYLYRVTYFKKRMQTPFEGLNQKKCGNKSFLKSKRQSNGDLIFDLEIVC